MIGGDRGEAGVLVGAVGCELVTDGKPLVGPAPALIGMDTAPECVHNRVKVGADPQPMQGDVVAGIADDGNLGVRQRGPQTEKEPRTSDPPGEHDHPTGLSWGVASLESTVHGRQSLAPPD
jgi:hypothetical protein